MQYTKYFSMMVGVSRAPRLSPEGFKAYMNVVSLECRIDALKKATKHPNIGSDIVRFNTNQLNNKLLAITEGKSPEELFKSLYRIEQ